MNVKVIRAHLALLGAASMWGLMSPVGKAAMEAGITGLTLATDTPAYIRRMAAITRDWRDTRKATDGIHSFTGDFTANRLACAT